MSAVLVKDGCMRDVHPMNGRKFGEIELRSFVDGDYMIVVLNEKKALVIGREAKEKGKAVNLIATGWIREISSDYVAGAALLVDREML